MRGSARCRVIEGIGEQALPNCFHAPQVCLELDGFVESGLRFWAWAATATTPRAQRSKSCPSQMPAPANNHAPFNAYFPFGT